MIALAHGAGLEFEGVLAAALGAGIADAPAVEHRLEQQVLLAFVAGVLDLLEDAELVLRDLPRAGSAALMMRNTSAMVAKETSGPPCSRGMLMLPRPLRVNCSISAHGSLRCWSRRAACRRAAVASSWAASRASASLRRTLAGSSNGALSRSLWTASCTKLDISTAPWLHSMPWRCALG